MKLFRRQSSPSTTSAGTRGTWLKKTFAAVASTLLAVSLGGVVAETGAGEAAAAPAGSIDAALTMTGQPGPHRVPGHYFTSPTPPKVQEQSRPTAVVGPSTPVLIGDTVCTITVSGYDAAGNKVAITAGHCGQPGSKVVSADAGEAGVIGTVAKTGSPDYAVIKLHNDVKLTKAYGRAVVNSLGGPVPATGQNVCKTGISTGTSCGPVLALSGANFFSHVCGSHGDSGAPVYRQGRLVGMLNGGLQALPSCTTPLQGPLHSPAINSAWDVVKADLNAGGGVGAGFRLP